MTGGGLRTYMTWSGDNCEFPTTDWSKLHDSGFRAEILDELCRLYWSPLLAYFHRTGFGDDQAKDLVQGFFTDKVLGAHLLSAGHQTRGRFRYFLLAAARNYAIDVLRKQKIPLSLGAVGDRMACDEPAETEFHRTWARELIDGVLAELEEESTRNGKDKHWSVFKQWVLDSNTKPMSDMCSQLGIGEPRQAYNMVSNMKKRFRTIMRRTLRSHGLSEKEIDQEILELMKVVSG